MESINLLVQSEVALGKETLIYQILGKFRNKLPVDVQIALHEMAEKEQAIFQMKYKKVATLLK